MKILFIGSSFNSEEEFKDWIANKAIKEGFMEIQPFKEYTKENAFKFVYENYNINADYEESGIPSQITLKKIGEILSKCPNTNYIALIDLNFEKGRGHEGYDGTYSKIMLSKGISWSSPRVTSIIHEFGHHFDLNDEYILKDPDTSLKVRNNCAENSEKWKEFLKDTIPYTPFKGCTTPSLYRSSEDSIMRGEGELQINLIF